MLTKCDQEGRAPVRPFVENWGSRRLANVVIVAGTVLFSVIIGIAVAIAGRMAAAVSAASIAGLLSLVLPLRYLINLLIVSAFVIMGQLTYFAGVAKAFWIPLLLGLLLFVRLPADLMRRDPRDRWQAPFKPAQSSIITLVIGLFFAVLLITTILNLSAPLQVFVSAKEYVFLWGLYAAIASGLVHPSLLMRIWSALPWLLPLQVPVILYQRFVVAARRFGEQSEAPWDAVVGLFGGDPSGGGMSGAMGLFAVFGITISVIQAKQGQLRLAHCFMIVASGMIALVLAEVKFAVLMLPVAFAAAFLRTFHKRPAAAAAAILFATFFAVVLNFAYELQYWSDYQRNRMGSYTEVMLGNQSNPDFVNMKTGEMGRLAAITFWASHQSELAPALVGHGMGASRKGETVVGEVANRWPFKIARSSLAILLWETGLAGAGVFILLLLLALLCAYRLSGDRAVPMGEQGVLAAGCAGLVLILLELPYNTDALYAPQIQILLMLILGQVAVSGGRRTFSHAEGDRCDAGLGRPQVERG